MCWSCQFHVVCQLFVHVGYLKQMQFLVEYGLKKVTSLSFFFFFFIEDRREAGGGGGYCTRLYLKPTVVVAG